ncbi:MAG: TrkA family potassium uptake protein [Planctomycetes bacterium]|nr:TrkA family potassium uptake protein [Planctomycetota bacterium]
MKKQAIVIGLGQFGMSVARALAGREVEVLALDTNEERVRAASEFATESAVLDATDEQALSQISPQRRDVCICAIGDEAREASIIVTALLRQLGAQRIVARANDRIHARILRLVGASQVVNPEEEYGKRFASQVLYQEIRGELSFGGGVLINELSVPESFVGHALSELELPRRYGVIIVAIRQSRTGAVLLPQPDARLEQGDVMVVVAQEGAVARMMEKS